MIVLEYKGVTEQLWLVQTPEARLGFSKERDGGVSQRRGKNEN